MAFKNKLIKPRERLARQTKKGGVGLNFNAKCIFAFNDQLLHSQQQGLIS